MNIQVYMFLVFSFCHSLSNKQSGLTRHINPFPPADAFWRNSSRRLLKTLWPKVKLFMMSNFSFGHNVFNFIYKLSYLLWRFFRFLSLCFQSRLLQICCMWEMVKKTGFVFGRLNPPLVWSLPTHRRFCSSRF